MHDCLLVHQYYIGTVLAWSTDTTYKQILKTSKTKYYMQYMPKTISASSIELSLIKQN